MELKEINNKQAAYILSGNLYQAAYTLHMAGLTS